MQERRPTRFNMIGIKAEPHVGDLASDERGNESLRRAMEIAHCCPSRRSVLGFLENVAHRPGPLLPLLSYGLPHCATDRATRIRSPSLVSSLAEIAYKWLVLNGSKNRGQRRENLQQDNESPTTSVTSGV